MPATSQERSRRVGRGQILQEPQVWLCFTSRSLGKCERTLLDRSRISGRQFWRQLSNVELELLWILRKVCSFSFKAEQHTWR